MILSEWVDVSVGARNLSKIRAIVGNHISKNTVARIYRPDFFKLHRCSSRVEILCDRCSTVHFRKLGGLFDNSQLTEIQLCNLCRAADAAEKMRETVRSPENRLKRSNITKAFYQTQYGQTVKSIASQKFKEWCKTENGKNHLRKCAERLPRMYGENHPNFNPNKSAYFAYCSLVYNETKNHDLSVLENSEKLRGLNGVLGAYQLDHIISKKYGFEHNIPPRVIGHISNLRFIPWEENIKKGSKVNKLFLKELIEL